MFNSQNKITIADVAKAANVSSATVSRAMTPGAYGINKITRQKVMDIVSELGYSPNPHAQSLASGKTNAIGIILPDLRNPFHTELAEKIEKEIQKLFNCEAWILVGHNDTQKVNNHIKTLLNQRTRGIILLPTDHGDSPPAIYRELLNETEPPLPVVLVANSYITHNRYLVCGDNVLGAKMGVEHLIKLGHRKIALITGNFRNTSLRERFEGYKLALGENGINVDDKYVISESFFTSQVSNIYERIRSLFSNPDSPTAIFVCSDYLALITIRCLRRLNLSVPEQISVVGVDNINFSEDLQENLTTVDFSISQMAKDAVQILYDWNISKGKLEDRIIRAKPRLVIRNTTAIALH